MACECGEERRLANKGKCKAANRLYLRNDVLMNLPCSLRLQKLGRSVGY
jgi:hypothetical protein